jgi:hypothetical protein
MGGGGCWEGAAVAAAGGGLHGVAPVLTPLASLIAGRDSCWSALLATGDGDGGCLPVAGVAAATGVRCAGVGTDVVVVDRSAIG